MTAKTFIKKVKLCVKPVPGLTWNSVQMSALSALARQVERREILLTDVPAQLKTILPLDAVDRAVESCLKKIFRE